MNFIAIKRGEYVF